MKLDAALNASATSTAIFVINSRDGSIVLEMTVPTEPEAIVRVLTPYLHRLQRFGHEATNWSAWLDRELEACGVPMVMLETHHTARMLEAQPTRRTRMTRAGLRNWCARTGSNQCLRRATPATRMKAHRRTLKRKLMDIENEMPQIGLMVGRRVQHSGFRMFLSTEVTGRMARSNGFGVEFDAAILQELGQSVRSR